MTKFFTKPAAFAPASYVSIASVTTIVSILSILLPPAAEASEFAVRWQLPRYAEPGQPLKGSVEIPGSKLADVRCRYQIVKDDDTGPDAFVSCSDQNDGRFTFIIPALVGEAKSNLRLSIEAGSLHSEPIEIPIAWTENYDVTGPAAKAIYYPMEGVHGRIVFVPCCNIFGGEIRAIVTPSNPAPNDSGMDGQLRPPFVILEPDHLTQTTFGLKIEMSFDEPPAPDLLPAILRFNRTSKSWQPMPNPEVDAANSTILAACPDGGQFIFAWIRPPNS